MSSEQTAGEVREPARENSGPPPEKSGPLCGVRVVELAMFAAGPVVGALLADWGAEVIKVESLEGDPFRFMEGKQAEDFITSQLDNRGKQSLAVDLAKAEGTRIVVDLIGTADIFVTSLRQQALAKFGLSYDALRVAHPRLVYGLLTGYGTKGADIERPAFDAGTWWGRGGVARTILSDDAIPLFHAGAIGDHTTGMALLSGLCGALYSRERTGLGQMVEVSMLRSAAFFLSSTLTSQLNGRPQRKTARADTANMMVLPYKARGGGWFYLLGAQGDRIWSQLMRAVGRPEWAEDPDYNSAAARAARRAEVVGALDEIFATRTRDEWAPIFDREGVWWTPIQSISELEHDAQMRAAGCFMSVETRWGPKRMVPGPVDFYGTPWQVPRGSPPVGGNNEAILRELGSSADDIERLRAAGVIR